MKLGILTSSRADFGIYSALLNRLKNTENISFEVIVFGTHLSKEHGYTVNEIEKYRFQHVLVETIVGDQDPKSISKAYANTTDAFAEFWGESNYDLVLCLGDRYEMNAAVQAGIPYGVNFGHFHGGETTLGAFDNIYRHQITLAAKYHFPAADEFAKRIKQLIDDDKNIYPVGSISLADITDIERVPRAALTEEFRIPNKPFILCTFHPETVNYEANETICKVINELLDSFPESHHPVVSLPNADTFGSRIRETLVKFRNERPESVTLVENFGKSNYFSAMSYADLMIGNSSSGIIEAASFGLHVINIGDRQKDRLQSENVINLPFDTNQILNGIDKALNLAEFAGENVYTKKNTIDNVIEILEDIGNGKL